MKLNNISIINYRSITTVKKIPLNDYSVIFGKNNEGKTNVLNAIILAMNTLHSYARRYNRNRFFSTKIRDIMEQSYNYERDYPISLQSQSQANPTILVLNFELSHNDITKFKKDIGIVNNGSLSIEIKFGKDPYANDIRVLGKKGKGALSYKEKLYQIIAFLVDNIFFQYIPAIRTEAKSRNVLYELVNEELENINDEEYNKALSVVFEKQKSVIQELSQKVSDKIKVFLPNIIDAEICLNENLRRNYRVNDIDFFVNDGNKTNLSYKGEGIKSLITLALLNSTSNTNSSKIVAIEEPESHLHPDAIHQIHRVIQSISETSQVIITTHNGIFANRMDVASNILIDDGMGSSAKSIDEIRQLLGIQLSDNLVAAELMVIVEGESDECILKKVFLDVSSTIKNALNNKKMNIVGIGGTGKIKYKCGLFTSLMCKCFVIVDADQSGKVAQKEIVQAGYVTPKDVAVLSAYGCDKESEIEDFIEINTYKDMILNDYGVNIDNQNFRNNRRKWSDRLKKVFDRACKPYDDQIEKEIKCKITKIIENSNIENCFNQQNLEKIKEIAKQIENLL